MAFSKPRREFLKSSFKYSRAYMWELSRLKIVSTVSLYSMLITKSYLYLGHTVIFSSSHFSVLIIYIYNLCTYLHDFLYIFFEYVIFLY